MAIFTQRCLPSFATVATVAAVLAGLTGEPLGATTTSPPGAVVRRAMAYNATEAGSSYLGYRIPSAVVARNGDLLVFAEGRAPRARPGARGNLTLCYGQPASLYDWKCYAKDIVARRSTDQGKTFGAVQTLAACNSSVFYTNPLGLVDRDSGTVWLAYVRCPIPATINPGASAFRNCTQLVRSSGDNGVTWSADKAVPGTTPQNDGGVGSGLQLSSGRLLFPRNGKGSLLSDDHGKTWYLGSDLLRGGESQAVQLPNGSVLMQMRAEITYNYVWLRSDDGGRTFGPAVVHDVPFVPDCPTSILLDPRGRLLLSHPNPANHTLPRPLGRKNLTLSVGLLDSSGSVEWDDAAVVFAGPSAYSSLTAVTEWGSGAAGMVGVIYELSTDGKEPVDFEGVGFALVKV